MTATSSSTATEIDTIPQPPPAAVEAAWQYERNFVPALFRDWCAPMMAAADLAPGQRVLDVACGTGILARDIAARYQRMLLSGVDLAPGMLAVAADLAPEIDWRQGDACALPWDDASFERVVCQYGLMFFTDRVGALAEMRRVLLPGGRLALAVWNDPEANPGVAKTIDILATEAGERAADALRAPFCLGDTDSLVAMAEEAGFRNVRVDTLPGATKFPGIDEFVDGELRGWLPVMDVHLDEETIARIRAASREQLAGYVDGVTGRLEMPESAHILVGEKVL